MAALATNPVFLVVIAIAPAVAILLYYLHVMRFAPEPWPRVVGCCVAGGLCVAIAAPVQAFARPVLAQAPWLYALLLVAPSEETLKLAAMLVAAPWPTRYERVSSGLMYGVAVGAAFACVENLAYVTQFGATTGLVRAVTTVPSHVLHSAIVGLGVGLAHRIPQSGRRVAVVAIALMSAMLLHGTYNALLVGAGGFRGMAVVLVVVEMVALRYGHRRVLERDLQQDMDLLASVPLFKAVPAAALRIMAAGATRQRVDSGVTVVRQGHAGDAMFQIMRGELEVHIDGEAVATLREGDFFGELALLTRAPRTADVVAIEDALLLRVPRGLLMRATRGNDALARTVVERARERFDADQVPTAEALLEAAAAAAASSEIEGLAARLATTALLAGLPASDLSALSAACVTVNQGAGARLVRSGRQGPGLCVVLAGQASVSFAGKTVTGLAEGDFFGEISLLTGWGATATVLATTPVELAALRWIDLEHILAHNPAMGWSLLSSVEERLARERGSGSRTSSAWLTLAASRAAVTLNPLAEHAQTLYDAFPQIRTLPRGAVETIATIAEPMWGPDEPEPGAIWIRAGGGLAGALGRFEASSDQPDPRWWKLSRDDVMDGIARCPDVVRFLARLMLGGRRLDPDVTSGAVEASRPAADGVSGSAGLRAGPASS